MGQLSTQVRLLLLTALIIAIFFAGFLALYQYDNRQMDLLSQERMSEKTALMVQLVSLYSEPLHSLSYDYSYWDDMVTFVKTGDSAWGYDNIYIALATYKADMAWVFATDWHQVYQTATETGEPYLQNESLRTSLRQAYERDHFKHFYVFQDQLLIEVNVAPIQPSNDNARTTPPQGILAVAKVWDGDQLSKFSQTLGANIKLDKPGSEPDAVVQQKEQDHSVICVEYPFTDLSDSTVAVLHATIPSSFHAVMMETEDSRIKYVGVFSLLIVLLLAMALRLWVGQPLKYIMQGLSQNSDSAFDRLQQSGAEFQRIGALVTSFFHQRDQLQAEVVERRRAEEALRASENILAADLDAMTRLQSIGTRFVGNTETQEVLDEGVQAAVAITHADFCSFRLIDPATGSMVVAAQYGLEQYGNNLWSAAYDSNTKYSEALERGERVIVEDILLCPELQSKPALAVLSAAGMRAFYSTPLICRGGCLLGVVSVCFRQPCRPDERTIRLIDLLCRQTADIIEQANAERELRDRQNLLKSTLESTADGILVVDGNGRTTHWNSRFVQMWHIPADAWNSRFVRMWQIPASAMEAEDDDPLLRAVFNQLCDPVAFLTRVKALYGTCDESFDILKFVDGRIFERFSCPLVRNGQVTGRVFSFRDITERKKAEVAHQLLQEKLEKAQRMESLGLLAGGVAHDLNNTLGPIVGYAELLSKEFPSDSKVGARLGKISKAAQDAAVVIQDLLTLARRGRCEMHPTNFNQLITEYLASPGFLDLKMSRSDVALVVDLDQTVGSILGSEVHLSKAMMNLITNAYEAMPSGGTLTVRTEQRQLDKLLSGQNDIPAGNYLLARVKDTGSGISPEDLEKIFEPYFSKKNMGRSGSGLGLSVVYGVVKDHHGYYDIFSTVGEGTEFVLYFPIESEPVQKAPTARKKMQTGTETILVVDDNDIQREMATEIIGSLGYKVHVVSSGREAVQYLLKENADLVLLDMIMEPDFDGLDTFKAIREIRPTQKAVIVSGYSATDRVQDTLDLGASSYLKKPYHIEALSTTLRSALDSPAAKIGYPV
jgi:signal transduction histidine kinase/ActR/RegA family two-component response regulator/sensor domain CHASE-containing protein